MTVAGLALLLSSACSVTVATQSTSEPQRDMGCRTVETCQRLVEAKRRQLMGCQNGPVSCEQAREEHEHAKRLLVEMRGEQLATFTNENDAAWKKKREEMIRERDEQNARQAERQREFREQQEARRAGLAAAAQAAAEKEQREEAAAEAERQAMVAKVKSREYGIPVLSARICAGNESVTELRKRLAEQKRIDARSGTRRPTERREIVEQLDYVERDVAEYRKALRGHFNASPKPCGEKWLKQVEACRDVVHYEDAESSLCVEPHATVFELLSGDFHEYLLEEE